MSKPSSFKPVFVRATKTGYYANIRIKPGQKFMMSEDGMKIDKAGKLQLPNWVERADAKRQTKINKPLNIPGTRIASQTGAQPGGHLPGMSEDAGQPVKQAVAPPAIFNEGSEQGEGQEGDASTGDADVI